MILLVPYPNLSFSAAVLNDRDLFDATFTSLTILQIIAGNHQNLDNYRRSVAAWFNYQSAVRYYHNACVLEWERRGYEPIFTQLYHVDQAEEFGITDKAFEAYYPPGWLGWEPLHASHRGFLCLRGRGYRKIWPEKPPVGVEWPGQLPRPGQFLVKGNLIGLVMEVLRFHIELLVNGKKIYLEHKHVERKKWVPDSLPVHERYQLEYGDRQVG